MYIIVIFSWGFWGFFEKKILSGTNVNSYLLISAIIQPILQIPFYYIIFKFSKSVFITNENTIILTLFLFFILGIGQIAYAVLLSENYAGQIVTLTSVYPIITIFMSVLILGEPITTRLIIGTLLILTGIITILN